MVNSYCHIYKHFIYKNSLFSLPSLLDFHSLACFGHPHTPLCFHHLLLLYCVLFCLIWIISQKCPCGIAFSFSLSLGIAWTVPLLLFWWFTDIWNEICCANEQNKLMDCPHPQLTFIHLLAELSKCECHYISGLVPQIKMLTVQRLPRQLL